MKNFTYEDAGVNKEEGYREVALIKNIVKDTYTEGVLGSLGSFSGLFEIGKGYKNPVLVSGTDGVGTKVIVAQMADKHDTVGIDCVAMCVNDILCQGAKPLFFLDYIATGRLVAEKMANIVKGVAQGCKQAGAALIGGETAEMPGVYKDEDYDMAGFCVGIVEKDKIIDGKKNIKEGDIIIGLASSGIHSNGYSLVRKVIFEHKKLKVDDKIGSQGKTVAEYLLEPTKIYAKSILKLMEEVNIHGLSHITGGGLYENVPRVLNENLDAKIYKKDIKEKEIFNILKDLANLDEEEMYNTFNMGVGMTVFVDKEDVEKTMKILKEQGEDAFIIGEVVKGEGKVELC